MSGKGAVHIIANSSAARAELARATFALGYHAEIYSDYPELIQAKPTQGSILAEDVVSIGGVAAIISAMARVGVWRPVIAISRDIDVSRVVDAIRSGATDYLAPVVEPAALQAALERADREGETKGQVHKEAIEAQNRLAKLTLREIEVLDLLVNGQSNKDIARSLQISPRTVEIHRANMMAKLEAHHPAEAIRCRLAAGVSHQSGNRSSA